MCDEKKEFHIFGGEPLRRFAPRVGLCPSGLLRGRSITFAPHALHFVATVVPLLCASRKAEPFLSQQTHKTLSQLIYV
jgi:hypothetical protein